MRCLLMQGRIPSQVRTGGPEIGAAAVNVTEVPYVRGKFGGVARTGYIADTALVGIWIGGISTDAGDVDCGDSADAAAVDQAPQRGATSDGSAYAGEAGAGASNYIEHAECGADRASDICAGIVRHAALLATTGHSDKR